VSGESISETARLRALKELRILDTGSEGSFDRITAIAAAHYQAPIALISLVDETRQWFKSRVGLDICETARDISFCTHAIVNDTPLVVGDAATHPGFLDNPLVTGAPHIRFYAGCPLIMPAGARIGTLCIIDFEPRPDFGIADTQVLAALAALVVDEMELRLAREKAEAENLARSHFIATMSHELKTPLSTAVGYAELLAATRLDENQQEYLDLIRTANDDLVELVNKILDLSRIEQGQLTLLPELFSPAQLLLECARAKEPDARNRGLALEIESLPDSDEFFHGDEVRIRQVLSTLLDNAIKFTNQGSVSLACRLDQGIDGRRQLEIAVEDTGIGVSPDVKPIVFDAFVQGDGRETREHYGAGLGLTICRELVTLMDGYVELDSDGMSGTSVRIIVPESPRN